jgi:hypothetical protein
VQLAYLTANQPPRIQAVSIGRPPRTGRPSPPTGNQSQGANQQGAAPQSSPNQQGRQASRKAGVIPIYWQVADPDGDKLTYDVHFRGEGETRWKLVAEKVSANNHNWQTRAVPDGTYYVKVTASDALSNPGDRALSAEQVSGAFLVDNTPPRITDLRCEPSDGEYALRASITDRTSAIGAVAYSIDAKKWEPVEPADGILDERSEEVSVGIGELEPGEHTVTLRAADSRGNTAASKQVLIVPTNQTEVTP